jgi:phosphoserine phosphatase
LIQFLKTQQIKTAVVSGGFTYFTQRLAQDIGLDYNRANTLAIKGQNSPATSPHSVTPLVTQSPSRLKLTQNVQFQVA